MGFLDQIGGVLQQYANGAPAGATREQAQGHYDQIASAVPLNVLASVIGPALASLGTPQIRERIQNSASEMSSQQRSDFMQTLLNGLKSSGIDLESSRRGHARGRQTPLQGHGALGRRKNQIWNAIKTVPDWNNDINADTTVLATQSGTPSISPYHRCDASRGFAQDTIVAPARPTLR